ncbi:hypothetical protein [Phenylobacterium sp.]|jgi:uncharacterized membrane protein|uniref:hypothetical protein n=1 Tax=Phenylobacterium sp. TaxID=1871053 RepID=UPI002F93EBCC
MRTPAAFAFAALLGLAAAAPAGAVSMNLNQDFEARGAQPAWTLRTHGLHFVLSRPGKPDVQGHAPGAAMSPPKASWTVPTGQAQPMTVTFVFQPCVAGDVRGPITAEVAVGGEVFKGCATPRPAGSGR